MFIKKLKLGKAGINMIALKKQEQEQVNKKPAKIKKINPNG